MRHKKVVLTAESIFQEVKVALQNSWSRGVILAQYLWYMKGCISSGSGALVGAKEKITLFISSRLEMELRRGWVGSKKALSREVSLVLRGEEV